MDRNNDILNKDSFPYAVLQGLSQVSDNCLSFSGYHRYLKEFSIEYVKRTLPEAEYTPEDITDKDLFSLPVIKDGLDLLGECFYHIYNGVKLSSICRQIDILQSIDHRGIQSRDDIQKVKSFFTGWHVVNMFERDSFAMWKYLSCHKSELSFQPVWIFSTGILAWKEENGFITRYSRILKASKLIEGYGFDMTYASPSDPFNEYFRLLQSRSPNSISTILTAFNQITLRDLNSKSVFNVPYEDNAIKCVKKFITSEIFDTAIASDEQKERAVRFLSIYGSNMLSVTEIRSFLTVHVEDSSRHESKYANRLLSVAQNISQEIDEHTCPALVDINYSQYQCPKPVIIVPLYVSMLTLGLISVLYIFRSKWIFFFSFFSKPKNNTTNSNIHVSTSYNNTASNNNSSNTKLQESSPSQMIQ